MKRHLIGSRARPVTVDMCDCPACDGCGTFRHPRWGSYNCPEPTVDCEFCDGVGEVPVDMANEYRDPPTDEEIEETRGCDRYHALKDEGKI